MLTAEVQTPIPQCPSTILDTHHILNTLLVQSLLLHGGLSHNGTVVDNILGELSRRNTLGIQAINVMISPVLRLRLEPEQRSQDEDLCTNKQEHDLSTPVELIGVDEVGEHGRQHKRSELLANKTKSNSLGTRSLSSGFLSDSPSEATNCTGVKHRPGDHEGEEGGVGGCVGSPCEGGSGDDDGPAAEKCTASDEGLSTRKDIGDADGDAVGEELES